MVLRSAEIDNPLMELTMSSKLAEVLGATVGDDILRRVVDDQVDEGCEVILDSGVFISQSIV
jgi:hypothetical protein